MVKRSRSAAGFPEVIRQRVFILTKRMFKAAELKLDIAGGSTRSFPSLRGFRGADVVLQMQIRNDASHRSLRIKY